MDRRLTLWLCLGFGCSSPTPEPSVVHRREAEDHPQPAVAEAPPPPRFDVPKPPPPPAEPTTARLPLKGTIIAHGGGPLRAEIVQRFATTCGRDGKLVLIPTASEGADNPTTLEKLPKRWRDRVGRVDVLHTLEPEQANDPAFLAPLQVADCVWLGGGAQGRLRDAYVGTKVQEALHDVLARGGVIGGYSAGAAILTDVIIRRGNPDPVEDVGFGVLPEIIVDQHFLAKEREPRLLTMLERHPDRVGYGIDEDTALIVHGSSYEVIGNSVVRRCEHGETCTSLPAGSRGRFP
jgi:cyanophycinase